MSHVHPKSIDDISSNDGEKTNEDNDPYHKVINLITHVDNLDAIDLFQYVVTAALLTTYLEKRTKFFDYCLTSEMSRFVVALTLSATGGVKVPDPILGNSSYF